MRNAKQSFYLVSGENANLSPDRNRDRTAELGDLLTTWGLEHSRVLGSYEGTTEETFLVPYQGEIVTPTWSDDTEAIVLHAAATFCQESVLHVAEGIAYLIWVTLEKRERLGKFERISQAEAETCIGWTKIDGQFYSAGD